MKDNNIATNGGGSAANRTESKDQEAATELDGTVSVPNSDNMERHPSTTQCLDTTSVSSSGFEASLSERAPPPTLEEVRAAIPEEGIPLGELVQLFKARVCGKENTVAFIGLVKQSGKQDPASKLIMPTKQ